MENNSVNVAVDESVVNTTDELLTWLKVQPRTLGWGAVLAYGRNETNKVLLQEYINRFSTDNYLKPITEEILEGTIPTQREFLYNYQMDSPRLSFANSSLQKSAAKLTMHAVGGTHLTYSKPLGGNRWDIQAIAMADVLDGGDLNFDIDLLASSGSVTSAGRVELDISKGTNYQLTFSQNSRFRAAGGKRMQEAFRPLPDDQKIFVLNEMKFTPDQFLKPSKFEVRTHNKAGSGARLAAGEDAGEGAVLLFVAMNGEANGTLPAANADLKYLLPEGHSATLLLGHEFFFRQVFVEGLKKLLSAGEIEFDVVYSTDKKTIKKLIAKKGLRKSLESKNILVSRSRYINDHRIMPVHTGASGDFFEMEIVLGKGCVIRWAEVEQHYPLEVLVDGSPSRSGTVRGRWNLNYEFDFDMGADGGFLLKNSAIVSDIFQMLDPDYLIDGLHGSQVRSWISGLLRNMFEGAIADFVAPANNVNLFTLNSLLFRGVEAVKLETAHFPADLAFFGQVGPTQTAFAVNELQPIISHSQTFQFTTTPSTGLNLKWVVENILGETVPKGSITANGLYTAPTVAQLQGDFVRVKVTASSGSFTSSALVTVMRRGITVNPLIQVATAGATEGFDVSAGSVGGARLQWSIEDPSSGAVVRPNPDPARDHSYLPGPAISKSSPTVDTLIVKNPDTNATGTAQVVVLHRPALMTVHINQGGLPDNQLQLFIMGEDEDGTPFPVPPDGWEQRWSVLLGGTSAQVDPVTGVLTVNTAGPDKFVVVTVLVPPARQGQPSDDGYIVLPLPLFSVQETLRMLRVDDPLHIIN